MRKFTLLLTLLVAMVTTAFAQTVVSNLADFNSGKCYTVTTTERGGWAVSNDQFCSTNDAGLGTSSDPTDANQQFAVLTLDNVDYYLYSVGAKKFVKSDKSLIAGRGEAIEFADASTMGAGRVRVNFKGIANTYINLGGSKQMTIDWWSAVDAGNAVQFLEVADFDPTEALAMLSNVATITYQFKYEGNVVATQEVIAVPGEAYPDYTLSAPYGVTGAAKPEGTVSGDETVTIELTIAKALPFEAVAEGEPTKWYYAQIHGNNLSYMTNPGVGAEMPWKINGELITAIDEANADNYTWGFVGNLWTGFKMVSKAGGAIKSTGSGNVTIVENIEDATPFIAMTPATGNNAAAEVGFCLLNAEAGQYMNAQTVGINHWTANDAGSTIVVTEREITVEPEPEAPFEVVAVTPTEAVAELTTVTVEFSEEIEGTFDMMGMTQIYLGTRSNGCSFEVNGKVLTITPFNAINTPGEYKLVIPEGLITRKSNGEAVTMNGEYVFTVKEAEAPFEVVAVTPTEAVAELTTVTVEFSEEIEGTFDMMGMTQIYLGTRSNGCSFEVNGKLLTITPFNAINTPGEYKLVIPEGLITRKSNGEAVTMNGEYVFTVKEAEAPFEVVAVTPTEAVAELTTVTVEFSEEIEGTFDMMGMTQIYLGTRSNGCSFEVNGKVLTITPFNAINTPGEYKLVIPEGLITRKSNGEAVTMNGEYVFTVKEAEAPFEVVAVTPTEAVEELTTVTVEFSEEIEGTFDMMGMTQIYLGTRSNGCSFEVNGKVLTITPFNAINTPGEYKLVIPEGLITRKSNGEAVTMNGEYVFTVKEAVVEPEPEEPAAGIEVGKHYRIKSTSNGDYLTIGDTNENQYGHVHGAALDEANDNQVFTFIAVEGQENTYYVQSVAGKYFSYEGTGAGWNVNGTDDATKAHALTFEAAEGELQYLIKCYNASKSDYKYFKYEYVNASGKYHPFNDADLGGAEVWTLEEVAVVEPEPEEKDENTIALIESANELLAIEGVGYPATTPREALKAAIAAAEEKPDTEAGTALQAAIDAYYATTDVVLPEGDKVYSLTMVAKNGNKFYLNYTGSDIAMVARTTDEELPNSAKFAAEDNGDGTISLKTIDGKYLVYHSKYAGLDWLQGRGDTDGLQETKDEMTNITFAKMVNGNKVEATGNEQIFGMLTWYGKRGYDTGKSEDCYGYMVLKTDGSDYDGASVPFWNDGYSSAFIVEETEYIAEPLNVVAVTPAEDEVVNSLREITIEFDAEIAVKELSGTERISIQYLGISTVLIGTTATVEGNTLKLVADSEIKDSGKHTLVIPAGVVTRVSDGVAYEGGTFTFTVEKAAVVVEPLTVVAVTPAESVEKLETITIEFSDKVDVPATASGKFTIADADGNNVATLYAWDAAVDGKVVTLTLTEAITEAGEYTFSFAEGLVTRQGDGATCAYTCTINVTGVVGIDSIYGEAGDSVIYDITGRKIEKITEGGIYIVNGKKVLVK